MALPPWFIGMLKKSDIKDASMMGDGTSALRNGRIGVIDRFTVYMSNLLTTGTDTTHNVVNAMAGSRAAISFASQIVESQKMPNPFGFGTLFKGLQVYGRKVVKPEALAHLYLTKGSDT